MISALVLTFHRFQKDSVGIEEITDLAIERYTVSPDRLEKVTNSISPDVCCTVAEFVNKSGGDWLILTFDDGLMSDYKIVFPILAERKIKGTFFVTAENIGLSGYVAVSHLRELADAGMEIGSHGLTHRYLIEMEPSEAIREIRESRQRLEQEVGVKVTSFAPVGGHFHKWMLDEARDVGYRAFATMIPGRTYGGENMVRFRRNYVKKQHDQGYVSRLMCGHDGTLILNRLKYELLHIPKIILGMRNYDMAKQAFLKTFSRMHS